MSHPGWRDDSNGVYMGSPRASWRARSPLRVDGALALGAVFSEWLQELLDASRRAAECNGALALGAVFQ